MRRLFPHFLVAVMVMTAAPVFAQSMSELPAGVRLRVTSANGAVVGELVSQSIDSVWLTPIPVKGRSGPPQAVALSNIQRVDRAHANYPTSILAGVVIGAVAGAVVAVTHIQRDHGLDFAAGVTLGGVIALLHPMMSWVAVPLK